MEQERPGCAQVESVGVKRKKRQGVGAGWCSATTRNKHGKRKPRGEKSGEGIPVDNEKSKTH